MNGNSKLERRLRLACEITSDHIVVARASERDAAIEACAVRSLTPGSVVPGLTNVNVSSTDAVATVVSDALAAVGTNQRDIITIIPDTACRIVLLDFDTLPTKPQEAESVVRFRLKKSMPFEIERARVSYDVRPVNGQLRVVAVVALATVVEEYEAVLRQAGYLPGFVLPSTVASLGIVDASQPTLIVTTTPGGTSIAIANNDDLALFRATEAPVGGEIDPDQIAEEVYPSVVFFQDTYGSKIERVLVGGTVSFDAVAKSLEECIGVRPQEIVPQYGLSSTGISGSQRSFAAGVMGALIS